MWLIFYIFVLLNVNRLISSAHAWTDKAQIFDSLKILLFTAFWVITFTFWYCFIVITVVDYISPSSFWSYQWKFTNSKFSVQSDLYIRTIKRTPKGNGEWRETHIQEVNKDRWIPLFFQLFRWVYLIRVG